MTTTLEYPDLELWAAGYLRAGLASWAPTADRRWPDPTGAATGYHVVVRDDSGPDAQFHADRLLSVTVLGPEGEQHDTGRCAERAAALLRVSPEDRTTPVVRVDQVRGPYATDAGGRRPAYTLTAGLRVVGQPINL